MCRGWWRWVDSSVGWSGWLCVHRSCCARETKGFRASTSDAVRQNTDQFHVARTAFAFHYFRLGPLMHPVAENLSARRRYHLSRPLLFRLLRRQASFTVDSFSSGSVVWINESLIGTRRYFLTGSSRSVSLITKGSQ